MLISLHEVANTRPTAMSCIVYSKLLPDVLMFYLCLYINDDVKF